MYMGVPGVYEGIWGILLSLTPSSHSLTIKGSPTLLATTMKTYICLFVRYTKLSKTGFLKVDTTVRGWIEVRADPYIPMRTMTIPGGSLCASYERFSWVDGGAPGASMYILIYMTYTHPCRALYIGTLLMGRCQL